MKKNKYIINEKKAEMIIESKKYGSVKVTIDIDDIEKCSRLTWHYGKNKDSQYIQARDKGKMIKLHRYIMRVEDSSVLVDHINRDTLDNRKCNLRLCNYQENSFNRSKRKDNTTGVIGVDWNKNAKRWRAKIKYNNVIIHLGYFKDLEEAALNRRIAEEILFGEYSPNKAIEMADDELRQKAIYNVETRIKNKIV